VCEQVGAYQVRTRWLRITKLSVGSNNWKSNFFSNHSQIFDQIPPWLENVFLFPSEDLFKSNLRRALEIVKDSSPCNTQLWVMNFNRFTLKKDYQEQEWENPFQSLIELFDSLRVFERSPNQMRAT
jgi:hypothetical protein